MGAYHLGGYVYLWGAVVNPRKQEAVARYAAGETSNAIAKDIGVHYTTLLVWVRDAGIEVRYRHPGGPVMTDEVKAEVDRLKEAGLSGHEIGRKLGINPSLVYRRHSFKKEKVKPVPKLNGADRRALKALADKLEAFLKTPKGQGQSAEYRPQIRALRKVLET